VAFRIIREKGTRTLISEEGSIYSVIPFMLLAAYDSAKSEEVALLADEYCNDLPGLFSYVSRNITYVRDPDQEQQIRTAPRTLYDRRGNCLDYSILFAAVLSKCKIPFYFKMVSFRRPRQYEHIYIVAGNGLILDAVTMRYNHEVKYRHSKKIYSL